jgi:hypothetical protein
VLQLTPARLTELARDIQAVIDSYADSASPDAATPDTPTLPVAVVARLFPLLPPHDHDR